MFSISEPFMNGKRLFLIGFVCVLCVLILLWILRTNPFVPAGSTELTNSSDNCGYQAAVLMQCKSKYVGDQVNVGNLFRNLPYAQYLKGGISLQTEQTPYGITRLPGAKPATGTTLSSSKRKTRIAASSWSPNIRLLEMNRS